AARGSTSGGSCGPRSVVGTDRRAGTAVSGSGACGICLDFFSFSFVSLYLPFFPSLAGPCRTKRDQKLRACAASAGAINLRGGTKVCGRTGASRRLVEQQPGERAGVVP